MRDLLQIGEMAMQQGTPNSQEIRVSRVVNLHHAPRILPRAHTATSDLHDLVGADDGKGHQATEFGVLLDGVLVILFDVVGEVVDGDTVVLDVFHDEFLGFGEFGRGERVGFADDGDDVYAGGEAFHQLDVEFTEAGDLMLESEPGS